MEILRDGRDNDNNIFYLQQRRVCATSSPES